MRIAATGTPAHVQPQIPEQYPLTTRQFADHQRVKQGTVWSRYCKTGSWYGIRPLKLANGRVFWPAILVTADVAAASACGKGDSHE